MTDFVLLADVLDKISKTRKRKEKVTLAGEFLRKVEIEEVNQKIENLKGM